MEVMIAQSAESIELETGDTAIANDMLECGGADHRQKSHSEIT
jgi:hypothetical protein